MGAYPTLPVDAMALHDLSSSFVYFRRTNYARLRGSDVATAARFGLTAVKMHSSMAQQLLLYSRWFPPKHNQMGLFWRIRTLRATQ